MTKAIHWLQVAWRDLYTEKIVSCLQKCGFGQESINNITNDNEMDKEFASLLTQLRIDDEITVEDFVKKIWSNKHRLDRLTTTNPRGRY